MTKFYNFKNLIILKSNKAKIFYLNNVFPYFVDLTIITCDDPQNDVFIAADVFQKKYQTYQIIFNYDCLKIWNINNKAKFIILDDLITKNFFKSPQHLGMFIEFWFNYEKNISRINNASIYYQKNKNELIEVLL